MLSRLLIIIALISSSPTSADAGNIPWSDVTRLAAQYVHNEERGDVLPFRSSADTQGETSSRKVFIHYFPPLPISIDNKDAAVDYWALEYMRPEGEHGKHSKTGGFTRQRPLPAGPWPAAYWKAVNAAIDVLRAHNIGADGFGLDIVQIGTGPYWEQERLICDAASNFNFGFHVIPEIDADILDSLGPAQLADGLATLASCPAIYRLPDGAMVFMPFDTERKPVSFWLSVKNELEKRGVHSAFFADLLDPGKLNQYVQQSQGLAVWGLSDAAQIASKPFQTVLDDMRGSGKPWVEPILTQHTRFKSLPPMFTEAENTQLFRDSWNKAIASGAQYAHVVTWNDYGEGTEIAPSSGFQYLFYDLSAYYIMLFKGRHPEITKDAIYYSHRRQLFDPNRPVGAPDVKFVRFGVLPVRNYVEMLAFLIRPATLEIEMSGHKYHMDAGPGLTSFKEPAEPGRPVFRIVRNGTVVVEKESDWTIDAEPQGSNPVYFGGSSTRPFVGLP